MMAPILRSIIEGCTVVLQACGLNYKTAPVELREHFAFDQTRSNALMQSLMAQPVVDGAVLLSTCNRTEVYADVSAPLDLSSWLKEQGDTHLPNLHEHLYALDGDELVRHLMRVASGLDSMVLGEPQILGQMKAAYAAADGAGYVSHSLKQLFPAVFSSCKHIRRSTNLGKCPVSVAYMAIKLIKAQFSDLSQCRVLLVGSGDMMELVATHLQGQSVAAMTVAGRHYDSAATFAASFQAQATTLDAIPEALIHADIMICATASAQPLVDVAMLAPVMTQRANRPLFIADLAVPRDVASEAADLPGVHLHNIDDLQSIVQKNMVGREAAVEQAEAMIALHAENYQRQLSVVDNADLISHYRQRVDDVRKSELQKAMELLHKGQDPEVVLHQFSHAFTKKLLHQPTRKLREFASQKMTSALLVMKEFLEL